LCNRCNCGGAACKGAKVGAAQSGREGQGLTSRDRVSWQAGKLTGWQGEAADCATGANRSGAPVQRCKGMLRGTGTGAGAGAG